MREYKYDEESVNALIEWSKAASFPEQIQLNDAETIFDVKRYVQANLRTLPPIIRMSSIIRPLRVCTG